MIPNRNIWLIATILATAIISATVSDVLDSTPYVEQNIVVPRLPEKTFLKRQSVDFNNLISSAQNLDGRIKLLLYRLRSQIPEVSEDIEGDIAIANRDRVILATANFLGMVFGIAKATGGTTNWEEVSDGNKIQVFAQILYGYGYWGPFALEYESAKVDCGIYEFDHTVNEYEFLTQNYKAVSKDQGKFYAVEFNHQLKKNLYCIYSRCSSNQKAAEWIAQVDLLTALIEEKFDS